MHWNDYKLLQKVRDYKFGAGVRKYATPHSNDASAMSLLKIIVVSYPKTESLFEISEFAFFCIPGALKQSATKQNNIAPASWHRVSKA